MDIENAVLIEIMPAALRDSHDAADNSGAYPYNGAIRRVCSWDEAEAVVKDDDGWTEILRDAKPTDIDKYGVLTEYDV